MDMAEIIGALTQAAQMEQGRGNIDLLNALRVNNVNEDIKQAGRAMYYDRSRGGHYIDENPRVRPSIPFTRIPARISYDTRPVTPSVERNRIINNYVPVRGGFNESGNPEAYGGFVDLPEYASGIYKPNGTSLNFDYGD